MLLPRMAQLDGTVHMHVGQLLSVNCDELCLPSDVNLKCLGSACTQRTFIEVRCASRCIYTNLAHYSSAGMDTSVVPRLVPRNGASVYIPDPADAVAGNCGQV